MKEGLKLRGDVIIESRRKDGSVVERQELKNLIVNVGKERVAKLINGVSSTAMSVIGIGIGTTSPSASDTDLETEVSKASASVSYEAGYKAVFEKTFTFGSGISYNITEAGVFDAIGSGGTMLDRFTFTAKAVDSDTDLYIKVTITVS